VAAVITAVITPSTKGCYAGIYWITPGRCDGHMFWTRAANIRLEAEGKKYPNHDFVYVGFHDHRAVIYRSDDVPRDIFSLIDPAPVVVEIIDVDDVENRDALAEWLSGTYLPGRVTSDSPVTSAMVFVAPSAARRHGCLPEGAAR